MIAFLRRLHFVLLIALFVAGTSLGCGGDSSERTASGLTPAELEREMMRIDSVSPDVPYVPTSMPVVDRMLDMADVTADDIVYDLGSGDGRIVIRAAERYGARGVGIEIEEDLVEEARQKADSAGVADRVTFRQGDLFDADISEATVVTIYLLPSVNLELRPKLFDELSPGTRVVSHNYDMDDWPYEQRVDMGDDAIFIWTIPEEIPEHLQRTRASEN